MSKTHWIAALAGVAFVGALLFDVLVGSLAPDSCPARGTGDPEAFPPRSPASELGRANAVPSFARKFNLTCTTCHTAFPHLNAFGRSFKEGGYRMPGSDAPEYQRHQKITDTLEVEETFPLAVVVSSTPMEKVKDEDLATRPLESVSLLMAGSVFKKGSAYLRLAGESHDGLALSAAGRVGAHLAPELNLVAGLGGLFDNDPYNTLAGHRLTAAHGHGGNAFINLYGRFAEAFYYQAGFSSATGNVDESAFGTARLAWDITPDLEIGAFGVFGQETRGTTETDTHALIATRAGAAGDHSDPEPADTGSTVGGSEHVDGEAVDVLRVGGDFNMHFGDLHTLGVFEWNREDHAGGEETNLGGYAALYYTIMSGDRPILMPLVRVDYAQVNDGEDSDVALIGSLSSYVVANARVGVEYGQDLVVPEEADESFRVTGFAQFAW